MTTFFNHISNGTVAIHGHRGARGLYPENTLSGFIAAARLGVQALEMDVVISKDHKAVVSHEAWMNPVICTSPDGKPVQNQRENYNLYTMDYRDIVQYDCGLRVHPDFPFQKKMPERKPLLQEVMTAVEACISEHNLKPLLYNIEIKTELPDGAFNPDPNLFVELVMAEIQKMNVIHRVHLQSFDWRILQEIKKKETGCSLGLLVETPEPLAFHINRLGFVPDAYSPEFILASQELVAEAKQLGMQFIPWTVNEVGDMQRMIAMGVNAIITDYPDRALQLLKQ